MFCPAGGKTGLIRAYAGQQTLEIKPLRPTCTLWNSYLQDQIPSPGMGMPMNHDSMKLEIRNQTNEEAKRQREPHLHEQDEKQSPKIAFRRSSCCWGWWKRGIWSSRKRR